MVESYMKQSALAHLGLNARPAPEERAGVELAEVHMPGQIGLRLDGQNEALCALAEEALGLPLALEPNTATSKGNKATLWFGPDEWLVLAPPALVGKLKEALSGQHAAVFDVSDSRVVISLSGANARDVLKKGCGLDLHPRVFGPGQCASSTLAMAHVHIHQTKQNKTTRAATYHLYVHRSFATYLWTWLEDAAGEYAVRVRAQG